MNIFDLIVVQPIFNLLLFIFNFVGDFGVAIIVLTIIIRFALLPLVKKQMRQTKAMREIQPELKSIKRRAKGDRMIESQMTMALYKEKGIKPMSSILTLIIQLPIFMAVFFVIRNWDYYLDNFTYVFMNQFMNIPSIIESHAAPYLFGVIDLSQWPMGESGLQWPLVIMALIAAGLQFLQTRQTQAQTSSNKNGEKKKMSDYFKEAAEGKEVDQNEMTAQMTQSMMYFFPIMTFVIAMNLPGAVVLYYATQAAVAVVQQHFLLKDSKKESETPSSNSANKTTAKRLQDAKPAEIIKKNSKKQGGTTVVRRVKAEKKGKK